MQRGLSFTLHWNCAKLKKIVPYCEQIVKAGRFFINAVIIQKYLEGIPDVYTENTEDKFMEKETDLFCYRYFHRSSFFIVINIIRPCREYQLEGNYAFSTGDSTEKKVIFEGIKLQPGVYRIELEYEADTDLIALCNVEDGTVFPGGLLCNGEHMYSGLKQTEYHMWLYEGTENLQVVISYGGTGNLTTGNLKITETNQLWTMLLTVLLFCAALVYAGLIFFYYDQSYPVALEKKHVFFWVMVIGFIASIPCLNGYNFAGADLTYHLQRIEGVKDGLLSGQFPVRLEPEWVYNHGYANAIFYCNTLLYFPAILRLLGFTVTASYNAYCIALNIATAWIAYYCFGKIFEKRNIGIICSALYTISIFRIYKLMLAGAMGEGSAFTFLPLVLYGLYRVFAEDPKDKRYKTAWVPIMIGYAGLMQTHVLTCEITAFVTIVLCIVYIRKVFCKNTFLELAKGAISAALVSLWFLVPFLDYYMTQDVHIRHVSARTIQERGLYWAQLLVHFWKTDISISFAGNDMQDISPIGIGFVLIVILGLFFVLWFSGAFKKLENIENGKKHFVKVTALLGALLLFMSLNVFPWDRIQNINSVTAALVSSLQFPNRFLGWGTVCLVMIFGFCMLYFSQKDTKIYWIMAVVTIISVATSGMYLTDYANRDQGQFQLYNEEGMGFGYISGAEYLVEGTDKDKLTFADAVAGEGVDILAYQKDYLKVDMTCVNNTGAESYVDVPLLLYKGYRIVDAESGQEMQLSPGENNVIRILIPANYEGRIKLDFVSPIYWRISEVITLVTIIILFVVGRKYRRKRIQDGK